MSTEDTKQKLDVLTVPNAMELLENSEKKPDISNIPTKSSMEILSELFSTFHAEPPLIIKKEKSEETTRKKSKKKKKHKHKEKKHKKSSKKKRKAKDNANSSSDSEHKMDLAKILIKQEKDASSKRIKIEGTDLVLNLDIKTEENEYEPVDCKREKHEDSNHKNSRNTSPKEKAKVEAQITDGELDSSEDKKRKKHKHKARTKRHDRSKKRSRSKSSSDKREKKLKTVDLREKLSRNKEHKSNNREYGRDFCKSSHKDREEHRVSDRDISRDRYRRSRSHERHRDEFDRDLEDYKKSRRGENPFYRDRSRERDNEDTSSQWFTRNRYRTHSNDRHRRDSKEKDSSSKFDKKKLLEIARKNAIAMMKSGSLPAALTLGPQAQEKVIAAIKSGGKTIDELTDFCKTLSKKEELGELSSLSEKDDSDSDADKPFHHPFQIKDRPTSITMNIKNSVPLPIKSSLERTAELRMQFPVSSGQQHRKGEDWRPVSPPPQKKAEEKAAAVPAPSSIPLPIEAPPVAAVPQPETVAVPAPANAPPGPQAFPSSMLGSAVDIGSIVSQRLTAIRRLQENPNDVQALTQMYKSNQEMQTWATSKQQLGQFTGSTGAQILSQSELSSGYQAWAKKDQLQTAAPVTGGMGMHLLQKMGWKPGEGLGKEKSGALEPLLLEVKLDKKGLVANEEQKGKMKKQKVIGTVKNLQGKHPVSLLGEYASKKKLGAPQYILEFECGPDHKKNFLFKVVLNGQEFKPNVASNNKKEAKAAAALLCLRRIGLLQASAPT